MKNRRNYYRVLQVQPDAPAAVIRASYHTLLKELKQHPDLGGDHWNATFLNDAYETLSDPEKRAAYDRQLFLHYTRNPLPKNDTGKAPVISYFCPFCKRPLAREPVSGKNCPSCRSPLNDDRERSSGMTRRSIARIRKCAKVTYYDSWPQKGKTAQLVDISPKGMRFKTVSRLTTGMSIKISTQEFRAVAVVRNVHKAFIDGKVIFSIGVEFVSTKYSTPKGRYYNSAV